MSYSSGQNQTLKTIETELKNGNNKSISERFSSINIATLSANEVAKFHYLKGKYYESINDDKNAYKNYLSAKKQYLDNNEKQLAMDVNYDIAFLLSCFQNKKNLHQFYLDEYLNHALETKNDTRILKGYIQMASLKINEKEANESLNYFRKALVLNKKVKDDEQASKLYNNLSVLFSEVLKKNDSSLYYLKKDYEVISKKNNPLDLCYNLMNQASNYYHLKKYQEAISLLKTAEKIKVKKFERNIKANINLFLYYNYKELGAKNEALEHYEIYNIYEDSIKEEDQNVAINEIQTKYKTAEKELKIISLENETLINYSIIGLLIIVFVLSILAYKNLSKKKKIIEQEKQLETQKLETTLKEQELHEIDVMLESQEKERQRIANELHDNLGSMLATLKLNFENLKRKDSSVTDKENDLFIKTDSLIEDAYQEVRNIAHLKNLGVIGSEGLVIAVKKMAEKMSVIEKLLINVIPHGLNERLENTLEVMLFRIIQELCTNIIKHSEATEVNIYLTQHNNNELNIIIEDNGIGFDQKTTVSTSGIGLNSIAKKVEQMNGTFTIDSILSKGTTIIIDLPI